MYQLSTTEIGGLCSVYRSSESLGRRQMQGQGTERRGTSPTAGRLQAEVTVLVALFLELMASSFISA